MILIIFPRIWGIKGIICVIIGTQLERHQLGCFWALLVLNLEIFTFLAASFLRHQIQDFQLAARKIGFLPCFWGEIKLLHVFFAAGCCLDETLGGGFFMFFYFHPETLGKIPILTKIFQMGWFNHQLEPTRTTPPFPLNRPKSRSFGKVEVSAWESQFLMCFFRGPPCSYQPLPWIKSGP